MTALALRDDQTYWDENQLAVLQSLGITEEVTRAELQSFLHECQRRKLDPFVKQIYLIGRFDRKAGRQVYRSQTSIDGFRLIARRAADKGGIDYSYEDTIWFDDKGVRHEVWLSDKPPAAAKVVVVRHGNRYDAVARYGAYVPTDREGKPTGLWRSMSDTMIAKCAEALALRKAFPEDLGGLYTAEEMAQADNPQRVQGEVIRDAAPPVETVPSDADREWFDDALQRAQAFADEEAGQKLWHEIVKRKGERKLTVAAADQLKGAVRARWTELAEQAKADEPVDGVIVPDLDPADPWALRVEEIASPEDAAQVAGEVAEAIEAGTLDEDKAAAVHAAIAAMVARCESAAAA